MLSHDFVVTKYKVFNNIFRKHFKIRIIVYLNSEKTSSTAGVSLIQNKIIKMTYSVLKVVILCLSTYITAGKTILFTRKECPCNNAVTYLGV